MTNNSLIKKAAALFALVGLFLFSGIVTFQLQTAFGWTNPIMSPPGGSGAISYDSIADRVNVNKIFSVNDHNIKDVSSAIAGTDAVNKNDLEDAIALAAVGSGKPTITLYGVSGSPIPWSTFSATALKNFANCLFGTGEVPCLAGGTGVAPGKGVTCPANWTSIWAGYGPYVYLDRQYVYNSVAPNGSMRSGDNLAPEPGEKVPVEHLGFNPVGVTYSICGTAPYQVAQTNYSILDLNGSQSTGIGAAAGILSACVAQGNAGQMICNTCRICQQN